MDNIQYEGKINQILRDETRYACVSRNEVNLAYHKIDTRLEDMVYEGNIDKKTHDYLILVEKPKIPVIFRIPKIHINLKNPPFRPIVSADGSETTTLAKFVDTKVKHICVNKKVILKDSWDLLRELTSDLYTENLIFVTVDIADLFSSIPYSTGMNMFEEIVFKNSPLKTPLQVLDVANCCLTHVDMAYLANSLHSEHLVELDLSGHSVTELFPSTFFKLLNRASHTLKRLTLEECNIGDGQINMMILGLVSCRRLQEFRFIGNPISSRGLKRLFNMFIGLPQLQYVEFPVPRECYPDDVTYPLDETTLSSYDRNKYEDIRAELQLILVHANREDISVSTPLFGSFDPNIHETSYELGVGMLQSFKDALASFVTSLKNVN
ncbi:leucine-rich repeat-containing protein 14B [Protopterus annectens]|uniref:leucine-rich repeat-containing protein 14B n=1 Tax=Protopterus annectens TaxID=7888 RepID=UPI001CF9B8FD|nr:leucine-rich repeat-containing protein 14B [Protopterus annectens]